MDGGQLATIQALTLLENSLSLENTGPEFFDQGYDSDAAAY